MMRQYLAKRPRGFTLVEVVLAVFMIGVIGLIVVPSVVATTSAPGLKTASNMLASDIEYVESACISTPQAMKVLRIDLVANKYWVASASSPDTPVSSPADGQPYVNDFATGRSARLKGVSITSVTGGRAGTSLTIAFDAYGRPKTSGTNVVITLAVTGGTMKVTIDGATGEVTVTS